MSDTPATPSWPEPVIDHTCPFCKASYRGEHWKTRCYDCYKNFKHLTKRIQPLKQYLSRHDLIYICHPSVTADELNSWIRANGKEAGWGAVEWTPHSGLKLFVDNTNFD